MRSKMFRIMVLVLCVGLLLASVMPASADAFVSSWSATCSSLRVAGTTDAPFVTLYAYSYANDEEYNIVYPVVNGAFDVAFAFEEQPAGTEMYYEVWGSLAVYFDYDDPLYWDDGAYWTIDYVPCTPGSAVAGVPTGFVPATITCNTPVYDAPAGTPVGSDRVTVGQSWSVNPTPIIAADGTSWTEIYVSGFRNPFIPTACTG